MAGGAVSSYAARLALAPMVRGCTLPTRLLALRNGADLVWSEELIDYKMEQCRRVVNPVLGTVDFVTAGGTVVFRTCVEERDKLIFQMGTADPARAVATAKLVMEDVAGIDVNMGCPKNFSLKGGMGAALLRVPDQAAAIMRALVECSPKPVTCKIRILKTKEETLALARQLEATGIAALSVHGRVTTQRPGEPVTPAQMEIVRAVAEALKIPVFANGGSLDMHDYADVIAFRDAAGCSSVMVARAAQHNLSVFRKEGLRTQEELAKEYVQLAIQYDNALGNTKYNLAKLLHNRLTQPPGLSVVEAKSVEEIASAFDVLDYFKIETARQAALAKENNFFLGPTDDQLDEVAGTVLAHLSKKGALAGSSQNAATDAQPAKRAKADAATDAAAEAETPTPEIITLHFAYKRKLYKKAKNTPKSLLGEYVKAQGGVPRDDSTFTFVQRPEDKRFGAVCTLFGEQYMSSVWHSSRKEAEQAAAAAALLAKNLVSKDENDILLVDSVDLKTWGKA